MAENWITESLKFLLRQQFLVPPERRLLEILLGSAVMGIYWDELQRVEAKEPFSRLVIENIVLKSRSAGLAPYLEAIKERYDQETKVRSDVSNGEVSPVPA